MSTTVDRLAAKQDGFRVRFQVLVPLLLFHILSPGAFFFFSWEAFFSFVLLWIVTGMLGVTVGYHRLLAHRSFKTFKLVGWFHALCASISFQQGPLSWVRLHRAHHAYSDSLRDPHPQSEGFFFGHAGWPFLAHRSIGRSELVKRAPRDLAEDPFMVFLERNHLVIGLVFLLVLYLAFGIDMLFWAGFFRIVFVMNATWLVNSVCHRWGYRSHRTKDESRNNALVALLTFGEGWHNNHHAFPSSARQGLRWWEVDLSYAYIRLLGALGLAWDIKLPRVQQSR